MVSSSRRLATEVLVLLSLVVSSINGDTAAGRILSLRNTNNNRRSSSIRGTRAQQQRATTSIVLLPDDNNNAASPPTPERVLFLPVDATTPGTTGTTGGGDNTREMTTYEFSVTEKDVTTAPTATPPTKMRDDVPADERTVEPTSAPPSTTILEGAGGVDVQEEEDQKDDTQKNDKVVAGEGEENQTNDKTAGEEASPGQEGQGDTQTDPEDNEREQAEGLQGEGNQQASEGEDNSGGSEGESEGTQNEQSESDNTTAPETESGEKNGSEGQDESDLPENEDSSIGQGTEINPSQNESDGEQNEDNNDGQENKAQEREQQAVEQLEETESPELADPNDQDNFVPVTTEEGQQEGDGSSSSGGATVLDTSPYYYVDLRPFSVFVEADRDITGDLGIPLYLLLEMEETLETMENVHISNLTIRMGVVEEPTHTFRNGHNRNLQTDDHHHWNELLFQGVAEFEDSVIYSPTTVLNVQSLVLSNTAKLQAFWDNEGGEAYQNLKLVNTTLLRIPPPTDGQENGKLEDVEPEVTQPEQQTQQLESEESTEEKESHVWVMVSLVVLFFLVCLCIICLAGRLRYLGSRAQERYNEKYGLDYNIYDKDISKDIFKEEYLMSEHEGDQSYSYNSGGTGLGLSDSLRSIDFLTKPISSIKTARKSSQERNMPAGDDDTPTEEEEEEMNGSSEASPENFSNVVHERSMSSSSKRKQGRFAARAPGEDGSFPTESTTERMGVPPPMILGKEERMKDESMGSLRVPPPMILGKEERMKDESMGSLRSLGSSRKRNSSSKIDRGDALPELHTMGNSSAREQRTRSSRSIDSFGSTPKDDGNIGTGNSSARNRSTRSVRSIDSFGSGNRDGSSVMGNTSGRDRSERSTSSKRSTRSFGSLTSDGSFYSCQSDLA